MCGSERCRRSRVIFTEDATNVVDDMTEVLLENVGPNGNIQAVVEADDDTCYFYLFSAPETGLEVKSVWVRNHGPAPESLDVKRMKAGIPPRNLAKHCRYPAGQPRLTPNQLRVEWLPEGNGAALYEKAEVIAIIPPWSGTNGFHGYARDCIGESLVAWNLDSSNVLLHRFIVAQQYWNQWDHDDLWKSIQSELISRIEEAYGPHSNYYAIDGGQWPPKAIVRIPCKDCVVLITVGVSSRPQPNVELYTLESQLIRRIEFGVVLPATWSNHAIQNFASYLSGQSNLPWTRYTWLGDGHTLPCDSWQNTDFTHALLQVKPLHISTLSLGAQFNDPVNLLWFVPITSSERQEAIDHSSEALAGRLSQNRWNEA